MYKNEYTFKHPSHVALVAFNSIWGLKQVANSMTLSQRLLKS